MERLAPFSRDVLPRAGLQVYAARLVNTTYDEAFYKETEQGSEQAARIILPLIREFYPFRSLLDVGCGIGSWVRAAQDMGISTTVGVDGHHVPSERLRIAKGNFVPSDLEQPLPSVGRFDLTVCLEVAEHLSPGRAGSFVAELVLTSEVIAFSAAIPFQGGDGHLNEAWPSYWGALFERHDYLPWDGIRRECWDCAEIPWWYRQNLLMFVHRGKWSQVLEARPATPLAALSVVHPECFLWAARRARAAFTTTLAEDVDRYHASQRAEIAEQPGYGPEFPAPAIYGRSGR